MSATPSSVERPAAAPPGAQAPQEGAATRTQIRGSSLLLVGRVLSLAVNFLTQVLIARYLSKTDFGVFAYGLSLVTLGEIATRLGLDSAVARFLPLYHERGEYGKVFGTILLALASVLTLGLAVMLIAIGVSGGDVTRGQEVTVVLILVALGPITALDDLVAGALAVFSKPRAIFFRRYVVAPGLRLAAIVLVMLASLGVQELALGYVLAGGLGVILYLVLLLEALRTEGVLRHFDRRGLSFPGRRLYGFALPLLAADLVIALINTVNVFMLKHFGNAADVASYRVVWPAGRLNQFVMDSFALLFTPMAARLLARGDRDGTRDIYWVTAAWMAVFAFPVFALTAVFSGPVTVSLFGARYADSAAIMTMLAVGYYFKAALGFNSLMLRVHGLVRYVVLISVGALAANIVLGLVLIPPFGAIGAGIATMATLILHNVAMQAGLRRGTGISAFDPHQRRVYLVVLAAVAVLVAIQVLAHPGIVAAIVLAGLASAAVLSATRSSLRVGDTFPELLRVPLLRRILA